MGAECITVPSAEARTDIPSLPFILIPLFRIPLYMPNFENTVPFMGHIKPGLEDFLMGATVLGGTSLGAGGLFFCISFGRSFLTTLAGSVFIILSILGAGAGGVSGADGLLVAEGFSGAGRGTGLMEMVFVASGIKSTLPVSR